MPTTGEVVRGVFTQHPLTKAVAFVTALAIWWYVGSELSATHTFAVDVPVSIDGGQLKEWRLLGESVHRVRVDVEGPRQLVEQLGEDVTPFTTKVRIGEAELVGQMDEEVTVPLTLRDTHFILPNRRLRVVRIEPAAITVKLGRLTSETVEVDVEDLESRMPKEVGDWKVHSVGVLPRRVRVVGPVSAIAKRNLKIQLQPPDLTGAAQDVVTVLAEIGKAAKDDHIEFAPEAKRPTITVRLEAKPERMKLRAKIVWHLVEALPEGFEIEPGREESVEVTVEGPKAPMSRLTADHLRAHAYGGPEFSTKATGRSGNTARLEVSVYPSNEFPGVVIVNPLREVNYWLVPTPTPPEPPGSGATPPGNSGQGPGGGTKPGGTQGQGGEPGRKAGG